MKKNNTGLVILIGINIMLVISSTALLHANEAEFILDRFPGVGPFEFSLFDTVLYVAYMLFGPFTGYISAFSGKRKVFVISGAVGTAFAIALMPIVKVYLLLLVLRFVQGMFCIASWQTLMTLILDLSDKGNRGRNMGIFGIFMSTAMGVSPVLGGFLARLSLVAPYYTAVLFCLLAALLTHFLVPETPVHTENIKPRLEDSLLLAYHKPRLFIPGLFNLVDRLHMGFIIFMLPLMVREVLNLGPEYRGMLLGINGSAYILLQYPIGRLSDKWGRYKLLIAGSLSYGALLMLAGPAAAAGLLPLAGLFFLLGIFSGVSGPPNSALLGDLVTKTENPLAMGFFNFTGNIGMVFGALFGGFCLEIGNFSSAFIGAGMIELSVLGINLFLLKSGIGKELKKEGNKIV